jgi:nucleoside-diphosphate-sugar epimerase
VVRPGFVIGPGGVFARLARTLRALPLTPSFYGGNKPIQTIAVDDLVSALVRAVDRQLSGSLTLAHPVPLTTDAFYRAVLRASGARPRPVLHLPGSLVLPVLQCAEALRLPLPMNSENLRGLQALEATDTQNDLLRLDLTLKSCDEALSLVDWSQL